MIIILGNPGGSADPAGSEPRDPQTNNTASDNNITISEFMNMLLSDQQERQASVYYYSCGPWLNSGSAYWDCVSSTPAHGNLHCNYALIQPRIRFCYKTWCFICWCTAPRQYIENENPPLVLDTRTCTIQSPELCPTTPPCSQ